MHSQIDFSPQDPVEEFNQHLAALARHQRQACALRLAEQLYQEQAGYEPTKPQRPPLLTWARRWLSQRLAPQPQRVWNVPEDMPDTEAVIIIDAEYTVLEPGQDRKERNTWTR